MAAALCADHIPAVALHGGLGQSEREGALRDFAAGRVKVRPGAWAGCLVVAAGTIAALHTAQGVDAGVGMAQHGGDVHRALALFPLFPKLLVATMFFLPGYSSVDANLPPPTPAPRCWWRPTWRPVVWTSRASATW